MRIEEIEAKSSLRTRVKGMKGEESEWEERIKGGLNCRVEKTHEQVLKVRKEHSKKCCVAYPGV